MVNKVQSKIKSAKKIVFDILKLKALLNENNFEEFLAQSKELYERSKSQDILDLIVSHLLAHPSEETEKYLKTNLVRTSGDKQLKAILKIAFFYLNGEQYANSKACVLKYIEKKPINSGFAWRILGNDWLI